MQPLNDICDNNIIRTSDDNVININEDVDNARGVGVYKKVTSLPCCQQNRIVSIQQQGVKTIGEALVSGHIRSV